MLRVKRIVVFFALTVLFYALLWIPWPPLQQGYAFLYRGAGDLAFRTFGGAGRVYFEAISPVPTGKDAKDTVAVLVNVKSGVKGTMEMNSRLMGYLPTAFVVALILATPVPWRRRGWALLGGVILMSAFAGLELALRLLDAFSDANPLAVFTFGPWTKGALLIFLNVIGMSPVTAYIAPIFVWIVTTFRRDDWQALLSERASPASL